MPKSMITKKIEYWEHQLLDLGKRNRMINYRETKRSTLQLIEPSLSELYDRLTRKEETLTFQRPVDRETDVRVFSILSLLENLSSPLPVLIGDIRAEGSILERQRTLKNLRAKARLAQEEQGTNILYLSFGFIQWRDGKGASAQWIKSPLLLVPAVLSLDALNAPYTLKKHEDDIVVNPTLEYYLKTEYGIELPPFDSENDTPETYFTALEEIADKRGWRILREVSLGLLSFLKISMYNDLLRNRERIRSNPVIRAMAGDSTEANDIPEALREFDLDSISPRDSYQVMSADSSQQDAILYSRHGVSFVMQGPPGTGKSQTITNIIAEALAAGKKVLFVSEKMAALQVVYRRLQDACLGDFCLPLHSYKANKKEVLNQIGANLSLKQQRVKDAAISSLEELLNIRKELNKYAQELHDLNPQLNLSCYEVYSKLEAVCDAATVTFSFCDPLTVTPDRLQAFLSTLETYAQALERLQFVIADNPWQGLACRDTSYEYTRLMGSQLTALTEGLYTLQSLLDEISEVSETAEKVSYEQLPRLLETLEAICRLPRLPERWLQDFSFSEAASLAADTQPLYAELRDLRAAIGAVFTPEIYGYDHQGWKRALLSQAEALTQLPLLPGRTGNDFIKETDSLQTRLQTLKAALLEASSHFTAAGALLDMEFSVSAANYDILLQLQALMTRNATLQENWLSSDLSALRQQAMEAKEITESLLQLKTSLLADWEPEILVLDYAPMLLRYKTDHTVFWRVLRPQYRKDKKQLQALSRSLRKELSVDTAVALLQQLKDYHEKRNWLEEHSSRLQTAFGSYYRGADSAWASVLDALEVCSRLRSLPVDPAAGKLLHILALPSSPEERRLGELLPALGAALDTAKQTLSALEAKADISASHFCCRETLTHIDAYLTLLAAISEKARTLQPYLAAPDAAPEAIFAAIDRLARHREVTGLLAAAAPSCEAAFGFLYAGEDTDWAQLGTLLETTRQLQQSPHYSLLQPLMNATPQRQAELLSLAARLRTDRGSCDAPLKWISQQFDAALAFSDQPLSALYAKLSGCLDLLDAQPRWVDYLEARESCAEAGLEDFIQKLEEAKLTRDIPRIFLKGFYHMWLGAVCDKSAAVRRFRRNSQDQRIQKFIELDDLQLRIAQQRIREKLIDALPTAHHLLRATDEVAILEREMSKRRNIMPLRKLFRMIPNLLMKLKPCLMMSPLSVSYFLETEAYQFDLVIFDEASQIFPEDAIGAIFRGSHVIIAGDSKQLPPTNFFASTTNNADSAYDLEDEENINEVISDSILEEAASVLPNRTLRWHYRSKHEELIAFSNRQIYKNDLITFPNSRQNVPDMGVEYIYVPDGIYDRSARKNNVREAEECVRLVFEHIEKYPDRSLGIIAFSESQQATIENAIIDHRERHPEYEWFFDESRDEPFFIKNLENVQGDERDTILFSICYGKDKNGNMYMNFGPVGHNGGERRLNVAITRAKCNIKLVGSILPSDIDPERAKSEGARMLRAYIEYARKGAAALPPVEHTATGAEEDDFCRVIAHFLEANGYTIRQQVGCSDYKIDIGVENPEVPGEFIAGIECDGLSYIQAKTARDRDHLRRSVLQNMGWNLYRVWSTEWIRNPLAEGQALLDFLRGLYDDGGNVRHRLQQSNAEETEFSLESIVTEAELADAVSQDNPFGFAYYEEADPRAGNRWDCNARLLEVVTKEQPIHLEVLYRRLAPVFGSSKVTDDLRAAVDRLLRQHRQQLAVGRDLFVRLLPLTPVTVRIPRPGTPPRPIEYIHVEEIAAAMMQIVSHSFGLTEDALCGECARAFGYERRGPRIKSRTEEALAFLKKNKRIKVIDGKVQLTTT